MCEPITLVKCNSFTHDEKRRLVFQDEKYDNFIHMINKFSNLVLVRHGESVWNQKGIWTGWEDVGLTDKGKREALYAAESIRDIDFDIAFTSDLLRAFQTLEIIKKNLKLNNIPIVIETSLKERDYGIYTGKSKREIKKKIGEIEFKRLRRGWDSEIPGGESLKDVYERVMPAYRKIIHPHVRNRKNILVVTHGNTNRALIKHLEQISDDDIADIELATGDVILYLLDKHGKIHHKEKRAFKGN